MFATALTRRLHTGLAKPLRWGMQSLSVVVVCVGILAISAEMARAQNSDSSTIEPTLRDARYGDHPRHKLHFWKVESEQPTPVVVHIHGGGWRGGKRLNGNLLPLLPQLTEAGISVVSVEYRLIKHALNEGVEPPVKAPLYDAARAVQYVRSQASEWNLDPDRLAVCGGSAGGCTSLWLAFHDDLADPQNADPVLRESSRPSFAAVIRAQTTLDPVQMKAWMPNSDYGSHAFGIFKPGTDNRELDFDAFLARRDSLLPLLEEYSPYALATADDPPVYLYYSQRPSLGKPVRGPTHSSNFGVKLHERLLELGVDSELVYPGAPEVRHATVAEYLIDRLTNQ